MEESPAACPRCGAASDATAPFCAPTPAGEPRRRLRSAASRMARVFAALVVAAFILTAVLFVVFSGRVEFAYVWPAMFLILLVSPSSRGLFRVLVGTGFVVVTG